MSPGAPTVDTLFIDDGGLPALAALFLLREPTDTALWHPARSDVAAPRRRVVVEEHARMITQGALHQAEPLPESGLAEPSLTDPLMLLRAASAAVRLGCARVLWPLQLGPDPDSTGRAAEQATIVTELLELEGHALLIELPLLELDDQQIVDLVDDTGAPLAAFWPSPPASCPWSHRRSKVHSTRSMARRTGAAGLA